MLKLPHLRNLTSSIKFLLSIFLANVFISFHFYLIAYINSSFLEQFFSPSALSILFIAGSILNLILLLNASILIKKFSNYGLISTFVALELLAILGLAFAQHPLLIASFFVMHQAVIMMILFNLDVFLEDYTADNEDKTGGLRGLFLTISNIILVASPTLTGLILLKSEYWVVYLISASFLIPMFLVVRRGMKRKTSGVAEIRLRYSIAHLFKDKNIFGVFAAQLILQIFYAWMVIYMPIYLHQNLGLPWSQIGVMFTIMLLPFVLFELPLGKLADKKTGEKEIMIAGFIITAIAVALIPFIKTATFLPWVALLFLTRVGASFIEISSETYFFKHVTSNNPDLISLFRATRPLAYIAAPALAGVSIFSLRFLNLDFSLSFFILALVTFSGIFSVFLITDTR